MYTFFKTLVSVCCVAWFIGFLWFAEWINGFSQDMNTQTDAIVVLTGSKNRIKTGFELLKKGKGKKLFITGVHKQVSKEFLKYKYDSEADALPDVDLGRQALDTIGNAQETAQWMRENNFTSLRLVTATYHMPRSLLEFRKYMPNIKIIPCPVHSDRVNQDDWWYWPSALSLMVREYSKFLFVYLKDTIENS